MKKLHYWIIAAMVLAALIGGFFIWKQIRQKPTASPQSATVATSQTTSTAKKIPYNSGNQELYACSFWADKPFALFSKYVEYTGSDMVGTATVIGSVVTKDQQQAFVEEPALAKHLYLSLDRNSQTSDGVAFYDYFASLVAQGNSVNSSRDSAMLFNLGIIENGTLTSSAAISNSLSKRLIETADTATTTALTLTVPYEFGRDAPDSFSYACSIQSAQ